jgi:hypothetical protein
LVVKAIDSSHPRLGWRYTGAGVQIQRRQGMDKWDYKVVQLAGGTPDAIEKVLQPLGDQGWEVAGVIPWSSSFGTNVQVLLKRRK